MSLGRKSLLLLLGLTASISTAPALDKDKKFSPPPISSITGKTTNDGVTVAAIPYTTDEQAKPAFGKLNPYEHGVLPVLMIIQNDSKKAIKLDGMKVEYIDRGRERIENTPAAEVPYVKGPRKPTIGPGPIPGIKLKKKKSTCGGRDRDALLGGKNATSRRVGPRLCLLPYRPPSGRKALCHRDGRCRIRQRAVLLRRSPRLNFCKIVGRAFSLPPASAGVYCDVAQVGNLRPIVNRRSNSPLIQLR
jgi:hypothetical protein